MLGFVIAIVLLLIFGAGILRLLGRILAAALGLILSAAVFVFKAFCVFFGVLAALIYMVLRQLIPFLGKHFAQAVPWVISAVVALSLTAYAFGRRIWYGEDAFAFIEKLIPREAETSRRTDLSLMIIELADSIHTEILSKLEAQIEKVKDIFTPVNGDE